MATSSLMSKLLKKSSGKGSHTSVLTDSDFFEKTMVATTNVPVNNIMLSGKVDGGISAGITQVVGDSRTFKTTFCLMQIAAFLQAHPNGVCIFVDSEFGAGKYFKTFGIDTDKILHVPVQNIEEITFKLSQLLEEIAYKDEPVIVFIDSISQIASKKEVISALEENSAVDMTRAKTLNSLWRIVTPILTMKNIPLFVINSYYADTSNKYAEAIIKGGKQLFLSSDTILMVTRSQEKDGTDLVGWNFNYNVMKSRFVKEKSKFTLTVRYDGGIDRYSGMFEMALDGGFVEAPKQGWYRLTAASGIESEVSMRRKEFTDEIWEKVIRTDAFKAYVYNRYSLDSGVSFNDKIIDENTGEVIDVVLGEESFQEE